MSGANRILSIALLAVLFPASCAPVPLTPQTQVPASTVTSAPSPTPRGPQRTVSPTPAGAATTLARTETAVPTPTPLPGYVPHRIGVRVVDGFGEFYDRVTGEKFVPRGFNYLRLAPMSATNPGLWTSTLNPGMYEPARAAAALHAMHAAGYNVVRVFVDCCREGNNAGSPNGGVSPGYLENVIDFLEEAKAEQIYVLLVLDLTPAQGGYDDMWTYCCSRFDGENLRYLTPGGHSAESRFDRDFIRALIGKAAPLDAVFAFDLTNEVHFSVDKPPFSLASGQVTTANQKTYDMASREDKQRMMDENLAYWIDQQRANILQVDPTALVTVSFPAIYTGLGAVYPGPAVWESTADFLDLHTYLGWGLTLEQYMSHYGVDRPPEKPLLMGELGAATRAYPTAADAAQALRQWQVASCAYGFDGWLLWTWDTDEQPDLWNGASQAGEISAALAPADHPDPCQP